MNKLYITVVFCFFTTFLKAQSTSNCSADLDKLYALLKKTPSYKEQIKGVQEERYQQLYNGIKSEIQSTATEFDCFYRLSQLLIPLKDNHLFFSQYPENELSYSNFSDSSFVQDYRTSQAFKDYPKVSIDLDSLESILQNKSRDSVEGIYFYDSHLKVGLYRTFQKDSLVGVVLTTKFPNWEAGQIAFILKEYKPNRFRAYHANVIQKTFGLYKNEKFMHASLTESNWKKFPDEKDYVNINGNTPAYQFKILDKNIQYLRLGSFSATTKGLIASQKFYITIKDSLKADHLIVDLRNNGGGGFKASKKYLKLLKGYSKHGRIYAIINNRTFSNTEQFTIKLKKLKNVLVLGETTNGTLTYGNNYGNRETLPSGKLKLYITDMKDDGNYLRYEEIGVSPDIYLKSASDWIEQVKQIIKQEQDTAHNK